MPEGALAGQRAIVTGGSTGIGGEIAEKFAAAGAGVWATGGSDETGLRRVIEACARQGVKAGGKCYDLSNARLAGDLVREGADFLGGLDILVNCAGTRGKKPFLEMTDEDVDLLFEVNIKSAFIASREAARVMVPQGSGRILNIGSIHGTRGVPQFSLYCATKSAMHSLTRALAAELGPRGIRVNCLLPGTTRSERVKKSHAAQGEDYIEARRAAIPLNRFGTPQEMADIALFLVSKKNDFMNGTLVTSDGGATAK
ncbi:MAG: SDR family oxidoreductase [bacterium]